jgi:hypothetical protein
MDTQDEAPAITENAALFVLGLRAKRRGSNVISLTPIGFIAILPMSQPAADRVPLPTTVEERLTAQLDRVTELVPARAIPLQDPHAEQFLPDHLSSLETFGERSRTFRRWVEPEGLSYFGLDPKGRPGIHAVWRS